MIVIPWGGRENEERGVHTGRSGGEEVYTLVGLLHWGSGDKTIGG